MADLPSRIVNKEALAELFGKTLPTIRAWVKDGCPYISKGDRGVSYEFDVAAVIAWREQKAAAKATAKAPDDLEELERRERTAKTLRAELELAKARGDVAPVREFERVQSALMAAIRQNVMGVPTRAVLRLLGEKDETKFKQTLADELRLALETAAAAELDVEDEDESDE